MSHSTMYFIQKELEDLRRVLGGRRVDISEFTLGVAKEQKTIDDEILELISRVTSLEKADREYREIYNHVLKLDSRLTQLEKQISTLNTQGDQANELIKELDDSTTELEGAVAQQNRALSS